MRPTSVRPATGFAYLDDVRERPGSVLAMAHRGGALHPGLPGLENTLAAFRHAEELGFRYLETDVHATRDGVLVAFHDAVLDRVTDRTGEIAVMTGAEVASARIGGVEPIPMMADLLEELPGCRFNIDIKSDEAVAPLADLVLRTGSEDRVLVGSFSLRRINEFRTRTGGRVATSAAPVEAVAFRLVPHGQLADRLTRHRVAALQVPHHRGPFPVVTAGFVRRAHAAGVHVHVWTVDDPAEMVELLDLGVDGLISDRTDVLKDVLVTRGAWEDHR